MRICSALARITACLSMACACIDTSLGAQIENIDSRDRTLCIRDEDIVLSCSTRSAKIMSFCQRDEPDGAMIYRFGRREMIELEHKDVLGSDSSFFYGNYSRFQVDRSYLGFTLSGNTYTAFHQWDEDSSEPETGISVLTRMGKSTTIMCSGDVRVDELYNTRDVSCRHDLVIGCDSLPSILPKKIAQ